MFNIQSVRKSSMKLTASNNLYICSLHEKVSIENYFVQVDLLSITYFFILTLFTNFVIISLINWSKIWWHQQQYVRLIPLIWKFPNAVSNRFRFKSSFCISLNLWLYHEIRDIVKMQLFKQELTSTKTNSCVLQKRTNIFLPSLLFQVIKVIVTIKSDLKLKEEKLIETSTLNMLLWKVDREWRIK